MYKIQGITKEFLEEKYWGEGLSACKIAKRVRCCHRTILNYLEKYNIPKRDKSEASKGKNSANFGKHFSEETRKKLSEANIGKYHSPEVRQKISEAVRGRFGKDASHWKGGRRKHSEGYILVYSPNHPHKNNKDSVYEHRLIVEKQLGRYLTSKEVAHHINGIKDNNRIENLMLFKNDSAHHRFHKDPNLVKFEEIIFDGRKMKANV